MEKFSNLHQAITWAEWTGFLYRAGSETGIYFHVDPEGAEFYAQDGRFKINKYEAPKVVKGLSLDVDEDGDEIRDATGEEEDIGLAIEEYVKIAFAKGYTCLLIAGETGAEVWGEPLEVVLKKSPKLVGAYAPEAGEDDRPASKGPETSEEWLAAVAQLAQSWYPEASKKGIFTSEEGEKIIQSVNRAYGTKVFPNVSKPEITLAEITRRFVKPELRDSVVPKLLSDDWND